MFRRPRWHALRTAFRLARRGPLGQNGPRGRIRPPPAHDLGGERMDLGLRRYFRRAQGAHATAPSPEETGPAHAPLPVLVHAHPRAAVPPGRLEEGMVAVELDDVVLHALEGILQPDGTVADLPPDRLEGARRVSY